MPCVLATGECLYTKFETGDLIRQKAVGNVQPHLRNVVGITRMRNIAFVAEARDLTVAPHSPPGPAATAVNPRFDAAIANFLARERSAPFEG